MLDSKDLAAMNNLLMAMQRQLINLPKKERKKLRVRVQVVDLAIQEHQRVLAAQQTASLVEVNFKLEGVTLHLNDEVVAKKFMSCAMKTLEVALRFDPRGKMTVDATLGDLRVTDLSNPDTQYPTILGLCDSQVNELIFGVCRTGACTAPSHSADAALLHVCLNPLAALLWQAPSLLSLRFVKEGSDIGKLTGHLYSVKLVMLRVVLEPMIAYFLDRFLEPLMGSTDSTQQQALEASTSTSNAASAMEPPIHFDLAIDSPVVVLPVSQKSADRVELSPGAARVRDSCNGELERQSPSAEEVSFLCVGIENANLKMFRGDDEATLFAFDMQVALLTSANGGAAHLLLAASGLSCVCVSGMRIDIVCPSIQLLIAAEMCELVRDIIQHNLMQTAELRIDDAAQLAAAVASSPGKAAAAAAAGTLRVQISLEELQLQLEENSTQLALCKLDCTEMDFAMFPDDKMTFELSSKAFTVQDQLQQSGKPEFESLCAVDHASRG